MPGMLCLGCHARDAIRGVPFEVCHFGYAAVVEMLCQGRYNMAVTTWPLQRGRDAVSGRACHLCAHSHSALPYLVQIGPTLATLPIHTPLAIFGALTSNSRLLEKARVSISEGTGPSDVPAV